MNHNENDPATTPSAVVPREDFPLRLEFEDTGGLNVMRDAGLEIVDLVDGRGMLVVHYRHQRTPVAGEGREASCAEMHGRDVWALVREAACAEAKETVLRILRARKAGGAQ
ncbi:hypothetical protein [Tianweitania sediminis]|uniref:Uncharacterized protein n=1 Tax=Tianweitania sediminis TaxID=1502156 RepID=A0A8J7R2M3_9HYPH|nr:hypothetical protein [Tianweitania sediminis]MBP0439120.1 hypothetical protein [Tianweitania sediminis]